MTEAIDIRGDIDRMMYQFVQTEIELPAFERWFITTWPAVDRQALNELCGALERDDMPWQDILQAFVSLAGR